MSDCCVQNAQRQYPWSRQNDDKDFRNDQVDAGEIGAGHSVTALYEVELADAQGELGMVRVRAKAPHGPSATEQSFHFGRDHLASTLEAASTEMRFATAVAGTADILRGSPDSATWSLAIAQKLARGSTRGETDREEFVQLLTALRPMIDGARQVALKR